MSKIVINKAFNGYVGKYLQHVLEKSSESIDISTTEGTSVVSSYSNIFITDYTTIQVINILSQYGTEYVSAFLTKDLLEREESLSKAVELGYISESEKYNVFVRHFDTDFTKEITDSTLIYSKVTPSILDLSITSYKDLVLCCLNVDIELFTSSSKTSVSNSNITDVPSYITFTIGDNDTYDIQFDRLDKIDYIDEIHFGVKLPRQIGE